MVHFRRPLENIEKSLTVREIMVPRSDLVCGDNEDDARRLLVEFPDYDVIPIPKSGDISGLLARESRSIRDVAKSDLTSESTSILDLVDLIAERKRLFVLAGSSIAGYVHFSDLNNAFVRIPFFVLLGSVETKLATELGEILTEEKLRTHLKGKELATFDSRMADMRKNRANLNWTSALGFGQVVRLAVELEIAHLTREDRQAIVEVRNRVAHSTRELVESFDDVLRLAHAKRVCLGFLAPDAA